MGWKSIGLEIEIASVQRVVVINVSGGRSVFH